MASTGSCPHCGGALRSDQKSCPNCGAKNTGFVADGKHTIYKPKTVEELKEYCAERGMPLKRMRFFIDEDYRAPKAFGIYRDGQDFVVYKNKADGSRAIRYRGKNEAYAVSELHQKLVDECRQRGIDPDGSNLSSVKALPTLPQTSTTGQTKLAAVLTFLAAFAPVLFVPGIILIPIVSIFFCRKVRKNEHSWPQERSRVEEPLLKKPIRLSEELRYAWNSLRYGRPVDSCLTSRERQIKEGGGFFSMIPERLPIVIAVLLIWGISAGVLIHNDLEKADQLSFQKGYYSVGDGKLYYHDDALLNFDSETYDGYDYTATRVWYVTDADGQSDWTLYARLRLEKSSGKLAANNHLKRYYLGENWQSSFGGSDFTASEVGKAYQLYYAARNGVYQKGYYRVGDTLWYRDGSFSWSSWYYCPPAGAEGSGKWYSETPFVRLEDGTPMIPEMSEERFLGETWDEGMGGCDCSAFLERQKASSYPKGYYRLNDGELYYNNGSTWYRESSYGWSYEGYSFDSDDAVFDDSYWDYYLDYDWHSDWGDKSYESWYDSYVASSSSSSSSSSSDSGSWSSSDYDSWDSSDTDWDSDW